MATQMPLSGHIKTDISVTATEAFDLATGTVPLRNTQTLQISSTASTVTCDLIYQDAHTLAGAGTQDYDLNNPLTDYWGATMAFSRVHFIYIRNTTTGAAAGASIIQVGQDAAPFPWFFATPATDAANINPGGLIFSYCGVDTGWPVGAGATDTLQIINTDAVNNASFELVFIGESVSSASTTTTAAPTTTTAAATTTTAAATTTTAAATTTTAAPTTTTAAATTTTAAATTTTAAATTTTAAPTTTTA